MTPTRIINIGQLHIRPIHRGIIDRKIIPPIITKSPATFHQTLCMAFLEVSMACQGDKPLSIMSGTAIRYPMERYIPGRMNNRKPIVIMIPWRKKTAIKLPVQENPLKIIFQEILCLATFLIPI